MLIPIDAKFPLDNFQRFIDADDDLAREVHAKAFARDVKSHIDAIAEKYIRPEEGTCEFAFMYLPVEGVYYELVCNRIGGDANPVGHAQKRKVFPVSPNSFYTYLLTLAQGFKGLQIEEHAHEVMAYVADLNRDFARFKCGLRRGRQAPGQRADEVRGFGAAPVALRDEAGAGLRVRAPGSARRSSSPSFPARPTPRRLALPILGVGTRRGIRLVFLWLGVALLGLGLLLLRAWWRERRFEGAALTPAAGLLLVASSVQQLFVFVMASRTAGRSTRRRSSSSRSSRPRWPPPSGSPSRTRRGRESLSRGASRPQRIHELEVLGAIARLSSQARLRRAGGRQHPRRGGAGGGRRRAVLLLYDPSTGT